ncbi:MAG: M48 family metallopeptidase [Bacteroidales bacterium]|nr:M48 family metallopeptidase [Bacteroidales bacterium]MDD3431166.1 M48 family metallopeptidase [Bacteroidales bacterium]MDD4361330.1 M48 family metallopeptidase [Bacteroidales bacterium]MDD4431146.1 M48 family metallopeptidase [Bacteroidales bacterium]
MKRLAYNRSAKLFFAVLLAALLLQSCGSVLLTGRKQLMLVSDEEVLALSLQQYRSFMDSAEVVVNTADAEMIHRIGRSVAESVENFMTFNGRAAEVENINWEFSLVKDNNVNAFAMPGGKVVVFTGMLPVAETEARLAVVIAHEIAHVIAKHSTERISQQIALQFGGEIAGGLLSGSSEAKQGIASTVFGLGAQLGVMMPYARKQEYEADELGLLFMAMAGYHPQEAAAFWTKMSEAGGAAIPEFLSTHPTDAKRIARIQQKMPDALYYYKGPGILNRTTAPIVKETKVL